MRISDWSSDVCSSDLFDQRFSECLGTIAVIGITDRTQQIDERPTCRLRRIVVREAFACFEQCSPRLEPIAPVVLYDEALVAPGDAVASVERSREQIGRASCRERVCPYGWIPGVAGQLKKK